MNSTRKNRAPLCLCAPVPKSKLPSSAAVSCRACRVAVALAAFASVALAASAAAAPEWTAGSYVQADWSANPSNVFLFATASGYADFVDGSLPVVKDSKSGGTVKDNATATVELLKPARIDELRFWTHWDGGRDGIGIASIEVKTTAGDDWTDLGAPAISYSVSSVADTGVANDMGIKAGGAGKLFAFLAYSDGSPLADDVTAVRINFGVQDNSWSYYGEVEAVGAFSDGKRYLALGEPGEEFGTVSCDPKSEDGWYAAGTEVTVKVEMADGVTFLYWEGTVPEGKEKEASFTVIMDGNCSLTPFMKTDDWVFYADKKLLTDGLQSFSATGPSDSIVVTKANDCGGLREIDFRRSVRGGGKIVGIEDGALIIKGYSLDSLYLPDTLKTVRRGLGELGLKKIEPFLPDSVTSVGGASIYSAGNSLYGLKFRVGYAKDEAGNPVQTVFELWNASEGSIAFKGVNVGPEVDLGPGVIDIPDYTFYNSAYIETLDLHGDVTNLGNYAFMDIGTKKAVTVTFDGDLPKAVAATAFSASSSGASNAYNIRLKASADGHPRWKSLVRDSAKVTPWRSLDETVQAKYWANWPQADGNRRPFGLTTSAATLGDATLPADVWIACDAASGMVIVVK